MKNYLIGLFDKMKPRLTALLWHSGTMIVAGSLDILTESVTNYDVQNQYTVIIGMVLAQITKHYNKKL